MTLRETLEKMKSTCKTEQAFEASVEGMKRRAQKGLLEGISVSDIDVCLKEMDVINEQPTIINEKEEIIGLIAELDRACEKYGYLAEDYEISDEEFEKISLKEFYSVFDKILFEGEMADKYYDYKERRDMWREENPGKHGAYSAAAGAGAGVVAASPFLIDTSRRHALRSKYIEDSLRNGSTQTAAELRKQFNAENPSLLVKAGKKIAQGGGTVGKWFAAHPYLGAGLAGAAAVGAGSLLALAIKKARRRRQANLKEGLSENKIFSRGILESINDLLSDIPDNILEYAIYNSNELVQEMIFEACELTEIVNESKVLNEAVTFVDGNGQVKTTSVENYRKTISSPTEKQSFELPKYEKNRLKKREYKLLDENLENYKKLSEMSIEEILAEAEKLED